MEKKCLNCEKALVRKTVYRNTLESVFNFRRRKYCSTECYLAHTKEDRNRVFWGTRTTTYENTKA